MHPNTKQRVLGRYLALGGSGGTLALGGDSWFFPVAQEFSKNMGLTCFVRFLSKLQVWWPSEVDNWTWDPPWKSSRFTPNGGWHETNYPSWGVNKIAHHTYSAWIPHYTPWKFAGAGGWIRKGLHHSLRSMCGILMKLSHVKQKSTTSPMSTSRVSHSRLNRVFSNQLHKELWC